MRVPVRSVSGIGNTLSDLRWPLTVLGERHFSNVAEFGRHLEAVQRLVHGREPLLGERRLITLRHMIQHFRDFYDGKEVLLRLREHGSGAEASVAELIARNGQIRTQYSATLNNCHLAQRGK